MIRSLLFAATLLIGVFISCVSISASADVLTIRDSAPQKYVVKKGDTLWDISETFLSKPWRWPELWRKNEFINNPHLIFPGDVLYLLYDAQGRPYLAKSEKRKVTLSPQGKTSLKELNAQSKAVPAFSLQMLAPYLRDYYVMSVGEVNDLETGAAKVIGMQTGFDRATHSHVAYVLGDVPPEQQLAVVHLGKPITDSKTEETIGFELHVAALGEMTAETSAESELASVVLTSVKREVLQGDFVVPLQQLSGFSNVYQLQATNVEINAHIVKAASQGIEIGKYDIVVLDAGENDGLRNGDVLAVSRESSMMFNANPPRYAQQLPARDTALGRWIDELFIGEPYRETIHLGDVLVVQVKSELSLAIVLDTQMPLRVGDEVGVTR